jgi:hypothetical protein
MPNATDLAPETVKIQRREHESISSVCVKEQLASFPTMRNKPSEAINVDSSISQNQLTCEKSMHEYKKKHPD